MFGIGPAVSHCVARAGSESYPRDTLFLIFPRTHAKIMTKTEDLARPFHLTRRAFTATAAATITLGATAPAVLAQADPLLTVIGLDGISRPLSEQDVADFDWHQIETHTRWTEGLRRFRGPLLRDVLTANRDTRDVLYDLQLDLFALNDFSVQIPASDAWDYDVILAREMDGQMMRVRDKGPLWLVYPRDKDPDLQNALIDERWVWQLARITVLP